jgi:uncharacterized LabA/DUF88 family protein
MPAFLPPSVRNDTRVMMFVDGENLAIRFKEELGANAPADHLCFEPDVFVWSAYASRTAGPEQYIRRYYYTSAEGDLCKRDKFAQELKSRGIETPNVYSKQKGRRSKRVDISLATDMLQHAHRDNYDIAILVSGDGDFVPLVEAVKAEGKRVALWALSSGLSPTLRMAADHYWNIGELLFRSSADSSFHAIYG